MAYIRKTRDEFEIQQYTGHPYGWECVNTEETRADARRSKKEYQENQPEYPVRIKTKRVPIQPAQ